MMIYVFFCVKATLGQNPPGDYQLVGDLEHFLFFHILGMVIPIDELIQTVFFRGVAIPPTSQESIRIRSSQVGGRAVRLRGRFCPSLRGAVLEALSRPVMAAGHGQLGDDQSLGKGNVTHMTPQKHWSKAIFH